MEEKPVVLSVLGYGCHLTPEMEGYLLHAAGILTLLVLEEYKNINLILSGGFTNQKTKPGQSEAWMMLKFFHNFFQVHNNRFSGVGISIRIDDNARTTSENIQGIAKILKSADINPMKIIILCEVSRKNKVEFFVKKFLNFDSCIEVKAHYFPHNMNIIKQTSQYFATLLSKAAFYLPILQKAEIYLKKRKMARS